MVSLRAILVSTFVLWPFCVKCILNKKKIIRKKYLSGFPILRYRVAFQPPNISGGRQEELLLLGSQM